ncbi:MAG: FmdB family zinc ribbon protein [Atopobiaceae bacterium]|jgi:putative FmdB family regulatory protein
MARYEYQCTNCGTTFEVEHPMTEHPEVTCPSCGSKAERVFTPSGIVFKGSGFYNTDQKDK